MRVLAVVLLGLAGCEESEYDFMTAREIGDGPVGLSTECTDVRRTTYRLDRPAGDDIEYLQVASHTEYRFGCYLAQVEEWRHTTADWEELDDGTLQSWCYIDTSDTCDQMGVWIVD